MGFESAPIENQDKKVESLEHKRLRVAAELQWKIMEFVCKPEDGEDCFQNWAHKEVNGVQNGQKFRDLFESALRQNADMLDEWDTNPSKYLDLFLGEFIEIPGEEEKRAA